jgi:clumping factor A
VGNSFSYEPATNVASKELATRNVMSGNHIKYDFLQNSTCIVYIEYDAERTFLKTTTTVEELKSKSTFVPERLSGSIYKYVNIWVGDNGGGLPTSLSNGLIGFRVEKSWINNNSVNQSLVTLQWYNKSWEPLYTKKVGEDNNYSYFTSMVPGFSFFAITYAGEVDKNGTQVGSKLQDPLKNLEEIGNALNKSGNTSKAGNADKAKEASKVLMAIALPIFLILVGYLVLKKKI